MATYFENTSAADVNAVYAEIRTALLAESWTETVINSSTALPTFDGEMVTESIFTPPGLSDEATAGHISVVRGKDESGDHAIWFSAFTAYKIADIAAISRSSNIITVTTTASHGFVTGDVVSVNGTGNVNFHEGNTGTNDSNLRTITFIDSTNFSYQSDDSGTIADPGAGGKCYAVYNVAGSLANKTSDGIRINMNDTIADIFGYVDEFRICGTVRQGGLFKPFYVGSTGREHVQTGASSVAVATEAINGTGSQTIVLDRTPLNMYDGQQIWVVSQDSADVEVTTVTTISGANLTASFSTPFSSGAVIGMDPSPMLAAGLSGSATNASSLDSMRWQMCLGQDGTRNGVAQDDADNSDLQYSPELPDASSVVAATRPDSAGFYQGINIILLDLNLGVRKFLPGFSAWPIGSQNDLDLHRIGPTAIADDIKVFISLNALGGSHGLGIGPGATP